MIIHKLDARRLLCPLPVIRTQDFVAGLTTGDRVEIRCTDPGAKLDIPAWCRINGHDVIDIKEEDSDLRITIEVGEIGN